MHFDIVDHKLYANYGSKEPQKDTGVKCHYHWIGVILNWLGRASEVKLGNETFYINNKSFAKFIIRNKDSSSSKADKVFVNVINYNKKDIDILKNKMNIMCELNKKSKNQPKDLEVMFTELTKKLHTLHAGNKLTELSRQAAESDPPVLRDQTDKDKGIDWRNEHYD